MINLSSRIKSLKFIPLLIALLFFFIGCAGSDKQLMKNELQTIDTLTFAKLESPPLLNESVGATAVALTGVMFGAIGGGIGGTMHYKMLEDNGKQVQQQCGLPDFNELVMNIFKEKTQEVDGWPKMNIKDNPVDKEFVEHSENILLLGTNMLKLKNGDGLIVVTTAQIRGLQDQILWQKRFSYKSKEFERPNKLEELEADNGSLLKEEYKFAAEKAVQTFIDHLNGKSSES